MTMVGADALHFGRLHSSANLICLTQSGDQELHTLPLMEVMASWCYLPYFIKWDDTGNLAAFED